MSLLGWFKGHTAEHGLGYNSTAEEVTEGLDLSGKTALITGVNSGLGHEIGRVLAMRGATVLGAARTPEKAERACAGFAGSSQPVVCELSEPGSVMACAEAVREQVSALDVILCNAGIMAPPELEQSHGYELQWFVNHIGHALLVSRLLDVLSNDARVVFVSSDLHRIAPKGGIEFENLSGERGYSPWRAYGQSKLANVLYARALAERSKGTERKAYAVHPGVIRTELSRHMNPVIRAGLALASPFTLKTIPQGAATATYAAVHPGAAQESGAYLVDCQRAEPSAEAQDEALARKLWERTEAILSEL